MEKARTCAQGSSPLLLSTGACVHPDIRACRDATGAVRTAAPVVVSGCGAAHIAWVCRTGAAAGSCTHVRTWVRHWHRCREQGANRAM